MEKRKKNIQNLRLIKPSVPEKNSMKINRVVTVLMIGK